MRVIFVACLAWFLGGCVSMPKGVEPVENFELNRYLGKWYEIARLDHSFERGLQQVSAEYSLRDNSGVKVVNHGYSVKKGAWEKAEGKAFFVEDQDTGYLKVSFFGPFYGSYVIAELDKEDYQYSFVAGPDKSYLWFLSRKPTVSPALMERFKQKSAELGFPVDKLIIVDQN